MRAEAAGEQSVAVRHLNGRVGRASDHVDPAREAIPQFLRSFFVAPTTVACPVVPEDAWMRATSCCGRANRPNGYASRMSCFTTKGNLTRSSREVRSAGVTPASAKLFLKKSTFSYALRSRLPHALKLQIAQLLGGHGFDFLLVVHGCLPHVRIAASHAAAASLSSVPASWASGPFTMTSVTGE